MELSFVLAEASFVVYSFTFFGGTPDDLFLVVWWWLVATSGHAFLSNCIDCFSDIVLKQRSLSFPLSNKRETKN
jgi:hypothetical protein